MNASHVVGSVLLNCGSGHEVTTGATVSITVTVDVHVLLLPAASVAVHVRVMVDSCEQEPAVTTSVKAITGAVPGTMV